MFEARLTEASLLKRIIEAMKDIVTDANIECSQDKLMLQAMDSSHVSLVHLVLNKTGFDHYRCDKSQALGLNLPNVAKILKCAENKDTVTLKSTEGEDHLTMQFENDQADRLSDFEMKLMDIDSEHLGIPETEYTCHVKMSSSEFQRIVRDMQVLGDTCTIAADKEGVKFSVSGDMGKGCVTIRQNEAIDNKDDATVIKLEEPVELTFAMRYLNMFVRATPLSPSVTLSMSKDVPLVVEYQIAADKDNKEPFGHIRYYLAPKIDDDNTQ